MNHSPLPDARRASLPPRHALWRACLGACLATALPLAASAQAAHHAHDHDHAHEAAPAATQSLPTVQATASLLDVPVDQAATPVELLGADELRTRRAATLGATLDGLAGVRNNHFGAGAGRPVIRGSDGPRVRVLSDGVEVQDASTSSADHAVALEPLLATEIEVSRGPATLLYGGGVTGGVVNVRDGKIPTAVPERGVEGAVEVQKESSAREGVGLFSLTGGAGNVALHVEGLKRSAQDYDTGSGWSEGSRVAGRHNRSWYGSVGASWLHERGYLGLAYSNLRSRYGLPGHSHEYADCHLHGNSLHCGSHDPDPTAPEGCHWHGTELHCTEEHGDDIPLVDMRSERWDVRGEWREPVPGIARARLRAGITDYRHDEIEHGAIGTTFTNKAHDARLELEHQRVGALRGLVGVQLNERKFAATGNEAYVEPSTTRQTAVFALEEYQLGQAVRLELGLRYEWQRARLEGSRRIVRTRHDMGSVSGGASWNFAPGHVLALSLSASERAPTAEELFSSGVHLASSTYERGNSRLKSERSRNFDLSLRKTAGATRYQLTGFYNQIADYIYAATTDQHENFRLIDYRQRDATFKGLEARLSHQWNPQWRTGIFGDVVRASFQNGQAVPRIPAHRLGLDAQWQWQHWTAGAEVYRNFAQNRIASYETRSPAYTMLNLKAAYHGHYGQGQDWELYATLDNALDKLAFNHTSFVKTQSPLRGRSLRVGLRLGF